MRLVVAASNRHKLREIEALLDGVADLVTLDAWPTVLPPDETGRTFDENARLKALYYAHATQALVVAEDSGLEIDALGGAPGVESARYGGAAATYSQKFELIAEALRRSPSDDRRARFVCALALAREGKILFEGRAAIEGGIAPVPRGQNGFGYDPIFFYPPYGRTLGEVTASEKAAVSHRAKAFRALREFLTQSRF
jgi:XTP/dITP diphosphohydrolase